MKTYRCVHLSCTQIRTHACTYTYRHAHTLARAYMCTPTHEHGHALVCIRPIHFTLLVIGWWKRKERNNKSACRREVNFLKSSSQFWHKRVSKEKCLTETERDKMARKQVNNLVFCTQSTSTVIWGWVFDSTVQATLGPVACVGNQSA